MAQCSRSTLISVVWVSDPLLDWSHCRNELHWWPIAVCFGTSLPPSSAIAPRSMESFRALKWAFACPPGAKSTRRTSLLIWPTACDWSGTRPANHRYRWRRHGLDHHRPHQLLAGSAGEALTCKHVAPDYYLAIFGWEFRLPFFARSTVSKNVLPVSWAILFCGWAHKVCRQYVFKTYLPVIVPFFGVKFWPTNSAGNTVSKPAHVLLARFFVEILTRFAGSKVWTPACQCAIFLRWFGATSFCRQYG